MLPILFTLLAATAAFPLPLPLDTTLDSSDSPPVARHILISSDFPQLSLDDDLLLPPTDISLEDALPTSDASVDSHISTNYFVSDQSSMNVSLTDYPSTNHSLTDTPSTVVFADSRPYTTPGWVIWVWLVAIFAFLFLFCTML